MLGSDQTSQGEGCEALRMSDDEALVRAAKTALRTDGSEALSNAVH